MNITKYETNFRRNLFMNITSTINFTSDIYKEENMGIIERLKEEFNFFKNDENYYKSIYYSLKDRNNIFEECFKLIVNDLVISWNSLDIDWFIFSFKTLDKNDIIDTLYYYLNIYAKFNIN